MYSTSSNGLYALFEPRSRQEKNCKLARNSIGYSEAVYGAQKSLSSSTEESLFQLELTMLASTEE